MIRPELVDGALDGVAGVAGVAGSLVELIDGRENDEWNWRGDGDDRAAVLRSSDAWWCVTVIAGRSTATRHADSNNSEARLSAMASLR